MVKDEVTVDVFCGYVKSTCFGASFREKEICSESIFTYAREASASVARSTNRAMSEPQKSGTSNSERLSRFCFLPPRIRESVGTLKPIIRHATACLILTDSSMNIVNLIESQLVEAVFKSGRFREKELHTSLLYKLKKNGVQFS